MQFLGLIPDKNASPSPLNAPQSNLFNPEKSPSLESLQEPKPSFTSAVPEQVYTITNDLYRIELSNAYGGAIKSVSIIENDINGDKRFRGSYNGEGYEAFNYNENQTIKLEPLSNNYIGYLSQENMGIWEPAEIDNAYLFLDSSPTQTKNFLVNQDSLVLVLKSNQLKKIITFYKDSYVVSHTIEILDSDLVGRLWFSQSGLSPTEQKLYDEAMYGYGAAWSGGELWYESYTDKDSPPDNIEGTFDWASIRTKYFMSSFISSSGPQKSIVVPETELVHLNEEHYPHFNMYMKINNREADILSYVGPLDLAHLEHVSIKEYKLRDNMNLGWWIMRPISRSILWILNALHSLLPWPFNNYGIILILFAFLVRIVTGPLTKKSYESNQRLQLIQPKMQKIRNKFKNDSQKMNQELIKLYREEGVNPMGGCLPMLLQMPLLVSLFTVFRLTIEFRGQGLLGSSFHWISDLSSPDVIPYTDMIGLNHIPLLSYFYGHGIGLLPLINGLVMILTMRLTSKTMAPEQKPTMFIMQGVFMLLFNTFPAGLNLYYTTYNILSYVQQKNVRADIKTTTKNKKAN